MPTLNALLARVRGAGDAFFAIAVLSIVALLVAPLTPRILDAGLALNLTLAATVLLVALFAKDALRFASFPTLLLLTTLFRLALNVSSTRLVLSRGDAGQVIKAFGQVVVHGNYVVGAVVFAILTLVQLLVVAKGAERVAEVAARFTLDAMPGKQMAIDADLRAGAIDQAEARRRRRALERESQLYGAMDGALKFVKGDAIAGIAIVLVNIVGGLVTGLMKGMTLEMAAKKYALLAIGDGLVSQIPALLIAVSAGVVVTRVAGSDEEASLGKDIGRELFGSPKVLAGAAGLCGAMAIIPGLPALPFLVLGAAASTGAWAIWRRAARPKQSAPAADTVGGESVAGSGATASPVPAADPFAPPPPVVLELAADLVELARGDEARFIRETIPALRERLWRELGVKLPGVAVRTAPLPAGRWSLLVDEVPAASGAAPIETVLALVAPEELALVGIPAEPAVDPASGRPCGLVSLADAERASALGEVRGPLERLGVELAAALRRAAHQLVGVQEVQALLDVLEPSAPALVREAGKQLPPALLAEVLRRLLEEEVSVRPLKTILEAVLEAGGAGRTAAELAEACRRGLKRQIAHRAAPAGTLEALVLDPAAEALVRETMADEMATIDAAASRQLHESIASQLPGMGCSPVLLTGAPVRRAMRRLLAARFPRLSVIGYDELPSDLPIRPVGRVALAA